MNDDNWKQVINTSKELAEFNYDKALKKLESLKINNDVKSKVISILSRMNEDITLLDFNNLPYTINLIHKNSDLIGKTIGIYKIVSLIAKGGMSSIYKATNTQADIQKPVALKILSPYVFSDKAIELFKREQLILSQLKHQNVVAFHHSGQLDTNTPYLVMEYIEGSQTIVDYCNIQEFNTKEVVKYIIKIAKVFSYTHDRQIIHRDIKPSNLLIDPLGNVKVIDFGIGQIISNNDSTSTQVFTVDSASPEQIQGKPVGVKTDIFSLGIVLLQLLVKKAPLPKTNIANYNPQNDVKHISELLKNSDLDLDLKNIISAATHIDVDKRYKSMDVFAQDMGNWLANKPICATKDSFGYYLKKLYQRNIKTSILTAFLIVVFIVSFFIIKYLNQQKQQIQFRKDTSLALIEALFNQADPWLNKDSSNERVKSFDELAKQQSDLLESDPELKYFFYSKLATIYHNKGLYLQALTNEKIAFEALKSYARTDDDKYLTQQTDIYHLMRSAGDFNTSIEKSLSFLKQIEQLPQANPKHRLSIYFLLSSAYYSLFEDKKALDIGKKAQDWIREHPQIEAIYKVDMYNAMAVVNSRTANSKLAEIQYLKAIELIKNLENQEVTLSAFLINFATFKGKAGDFITSEKYYKKAIKIVEKIDTNHPTLSKAYSNYSVMLKLTDRFQESLDSINKAIKILKSNGQNDSRLAYTLIKSAKMSFIHDDIDSAIKSLMESFKIRISLTDIDHPDIIEVYNLALVVFLLDEDKTNATRLITYVDQQYFSKIINTKNYITYTVFRSITLKQIDLNDSSQSVVSQFLYDDKLITDENKVMWLQQHLLEFTDKSHIFTIWLKSQLFKLIPNEVDFKNICYKNIEWNKSEKLFIKLMILETCIHQEKTHDSYVHENIKESYNKLKNSQNININLKKQLIKLLTQQ